MDAESIQCVSDDYNNDYSDLSGDETDTMSKRAQDNEALRRFYRVTAPCSSDDDDDTQFD